MLKAWAKDRIEVSFFVKFESTLRTNNATEVEGFFNLLFAHLFALYSPSSPELKKYIISLLEAISSSSSERLSIRYRMYLLVSSFHLLEP